MQAFEHPAERLEPVLHYVIARTEGLEFGAVKLNKAVVEADVEHYRRYGRSITGAAFFQKQRLGPVPNGVLKALKALRNARKIEPREVPTPAGNRTEYIALREPDLKTFGPGEIDVMNVAIASLQRLTANEASDRTHDALWDEVEMFGQIPVRAAAFQPGPIDQEALAWAMAGDD